MVPRQAVTIDAFIRELRRMPGSAFSSVDEVQALAEGNTLEPNSLSRYLFWDAQHYTRNLIDKTSLYELIAICWEPGQMSSIHNHRDQNCWMMVPIGRLLVQNYSVLSQDLPAGTSEIEKTGLIEMNPENPMAVNPKEPVHRVYNPRELGRAVSVHIYSRPFDTCDVYSEEQRACGTIRLNYTSEYGVLKERNHLSSNDRILSGN